MSWEMAIVRSVFILILIAASYHLQPFQLSHLNSVLVGALLGFFFVLFEMRLEKASLRKLIGAAVGSILGILGALMISHLLNLTSIEKSSISFVQVALLMLMAYVGLVLGASKGDLLNLAAMGGIFSAERQGRKSSKILDTSVIIDGRIADICDTAFIEGELVVPQFVLKELQLIADSPDSLKRQRGRRGLDVLNHLQKSSQVSVSVSDLDFPEIRDVDSKLLECAKSLGAKIITNDFNLNKVARIHGIPVLNINELANALRPVVLPGESMTVFILKEGKERDQGVAYLDDGTMVVVDNSRRMIGQTIPITVTSVLQTTVGKMIFGRFNGEGR